MTQVAPHYRLSIIPGWIVTDPRLKGKDLQVLCLLGRHTSSKDGWCRRSQVKMAGELSCSRSTIQASLDRLAEMAVIEKRIVSSPDGRDSAHRYRVIYDRDPESFANSAWDDEDGEENDPTSEAATDTPPAGISAGGADSGQAPPADSGPAPINPSNLTTPLNREERERERDFEGEEDRKAVERDFKKFFIGWKTAISDSEPEARGCWQALTAEERAQALERSAQYQDAALSTGRKHLCSAARYLKEKRWEKLQALNVQAQASAAPEAYTAYSRAGRGLLFSELLRPQRYLQLTPLEQTIIDSKPEKREIIWRDKREKQGWPEAVKLIETTMQHKRFNVPSRIVERSQDFEKVRVGSAEWEAWRELHHRRCWPWLPAPDKLEWMQFPPLPTDMEADLGTLVEEALARFQAKIEVRGNDDAA